MKKGCSKFKRGFTLIELLVVISIIALLASIIIGGLSVTRARAQTTKRIQDTGQVQKAVELYRASEGSYPAAGVICWECGDANYKVNRDNNALATAISPYLKTLPRDPNLPASGAFTDESGYWYLSNGNDYKIVNVTNADQAPYIPPSLLDTNFVSNPGRVGISVTSSSHPKTWNNGCNMSDGDCASSVVVANNTTLPGPLLGYRVSTSPSMSTQPAWTIIPQGSTMTISVPDNQIIEFVSSAPWGISPSPTHGWVADPVTASYYSDYSQPVPTNITFSN